MTINESTMNHYLEHMPIQMIELIESLNSRPKWAVFVALLENKQMYFNQIKDEFGANPAEVDRILKSLGAGGLIFKRAQKFSEVNDGNRSYYEPSLLGEMFYDSMFNLIIPRRVSKNNSSEEYYNLSASISPKFNSCLETSFSKSQTPISTIPSQTQIPPTFQRNVNYEKITVEV